MILLGVRYDGRKRTFMENISVCSAVHLWLELSSFRLYVSILFESYSFQENQCYRFITSGLWKLQVTKFQLSYKEFTHKHVDGNYTASCFNHITNQKLCFPPEPRTFDEPAGTSRTLILGLITTFPCLASGWHLQKLEHCMTPTAKCLRENYLMQLLYDILYQTC